MRITLSLTILLFVLVSCQEKKENADVLVYNGTIYTVNDSFSNAEAFAIKDGKFLTVGNEKDLRETYQFGKEVDVKGKTVVPGFIDAHCHFYNLGLAQNRIDLSGTTSFNEVVQRVVDFQKKRKTNFIIGRGWDQNDWEVKEFPTNDTLNMLFPNIPVALTRIDGHAMLANNKALEVGGIDLNTNIAGGDIFKSEGKLTGVLIDNPMELIEAKYPEPTKEEKITALKEAQEICTKLGLTSVSDAGLSKDVLDLIEEMQSNGTLSMRIYAMLTNNQENFDHYLKKGIIKTDRLNIRSFKIYADGALGSRGACLKDEYSDKEHHFGAMIIGLDDFRNKAEQLANSEFQMNTHAIGDSANAVVLRVYDEVLKNKKNRRWRVEHAQVMGEEDFKFFSKNIIPSIQPTHATSDMYWAEDRVGAKRIPNAYAYKRLLEESGIVALGTDFPVEKVNPMHTFYAAVARKDLNNYPEGGFQKQNALTREETLKGMTVWAAYSNFEENEKGSIEVGKFADFIVLEKDIMQIPEDELPNVKVLQTYIGGEHIK